MGDHVEGAAERRLTDWRGNDYGVGDTIVYARQSGHSVQLVEAEVLEFSEVKSGWNAGKPTVVVRPLRSSRWSWNWPDRKDKDRVVLTILENVTKVDSCN